jgi:hypothetical protein
VVSSRFIARFTSAEQDTRVHSFTFTSCKHAVYTLIINVTRAWISEHPRVAPLFVLYIKVLSSLKNSHFDSTYWSLNVGTPPIPLYTSFTDRGHQGTQSLPFRFLLRCPRYFFHRKIHKLL